MWRENYAASALHEADDEIPEESSGMWIHPCCRFILKQKETLMSSVYASNEKCVLFFKDLLNWAYGFESAKCSINKFLW